MSGGSMNYIYCRLKEAAGMTCDKEISDLLYDLADLLHDEEWWTSGDYSEKDYKESLTKFKAKWFNGNRKERLKSYIDESIKKTKDELYSIIGE